MVLVVNTELSMGAGKVSGAGGGGGAGRRRAARRGVTAGSLQTAAQAGHAAVGLYRLAEQQPAGREALQCWDECG